MFFDQQAFEVRCEWGSAGIKALAPDSKAIIIVDVLSFSTCVDIAVSKGAQVYPYRFKDDSADDYAKSLGAVLASPIRNSNTEFSLSPTSLSKIPAGTRLVLPSPNGATLSLATGPVPTFAACLRNAQAVALAVEQLGRPISLIPAGERWADGSLRPAFEDWLGVGLIISYLSGTKSPEAQAAEVMARHFKPDLLNYLKQCGSGKELIGGGFEADVELAAALNHSDCVPILKNGAYIRFT